MLATITTDSIWDCNVAGALKYWTYEGKPDEVHGFNFTCPCGCGKIGSVRFASARVPTGWAWNGSRLAPTVTPSIDLQTSDAQGQLVSHWHGWLTDGMWKA
jgi:hypothetical protein